MTTVAAPTAVRPRPAGFVSDLVAIAGRAIRGALREPEQLIPALTIPAFFFIVNIGALEGVGEQGGVTDYKAFQLPMAIIFGVTGVSRAYALVLDIQGGYFNRLLLTPVSRLALILGLMAADFLAVCALTAPVVLLGYIVGVSFATGVTGVIVFIAMAGLWGVAFAGVPYAIAFKTGNPAAVNTSWLLFLPLAFLTTGFLPQEALAGWLSTAADYNPMTYLLSGMRSLAMTGWDAGALAEGFAAILGVGTLSIWMTFAALRGRIKRGA